MDNFKQMTIIPFSVVVLRQFFNLLQISQLRIKYGTEGGEAMQKITDSWYALYTKPRWEKKVYNLLLCQGIEAYCPLTKVRKKWSDRMKWVEEPLFKSYVFARMKEAELPLVRKVDGVVNFVYWLGKPAVIPQKDIEIVRRFLNEYMEVYAEPLTLTVDSKIVIRQGIFMDKEAKVVKVFNKKVKVIIESIGYSLVAVIDRSNTTFARRNGLNNKLN